MKTGILLLGHGSRVPEANQILFKTAQTLYKQGLWLAVEPAFLQLAEPTLSQGIASLVKAGARKIVVVCFFLCDGNHVKEDIPQAIAAEAVKYPGVRILTTTSIGDDPRMLQIIADKIEGVLS